MGSRVGWLPTDLPETTIGWGEETWRELGLCPTEKGDSPHKMGRISVRQGARSLLERSTWNKTPEPRPYSPQLPGVELGPTSKEARGSEQRLESDFC